MKDDKNPCKTSPSDQTTLSLEELFSESKELIAQQNSRINTFIKLVDYSVTELYNRVIETQDELFMKDKLLMQIVHSLHKIEEQLANLKNTPEGQENDKD